MSSAIAVDGLRRPAETRMIPYRFSVEQYRRMIEAGVFVNARCELIEGLVVQKATHNPPHAGSISAIQLRISRHLSEEWVLRIQSSISLPQSQPEPDLVVATGPAERYFRQHPHPRDIALIVEVAESSLAQDRIEKKRIYASARLPVYWIVNLIAGQVEVYTGPRAGRSPEYRQREDFLRGDSVPVVLDGKELTRLAVRELLP
jgi:Uma2 family endonuclease